MKASRRGRGARLITVRVASAGILGLGLVAALAAGPAAVAAQGQQVPRASVPCAAGGPCMLGDVGPGGGIVIYDAGSVQPWGRYLEMAPNGWSGNATDPKAAWCSDTSTNIPAPMDTWIGAGKANTASMLAACTSGAANLAVAYTSPIFDTSPPASTTEPGPGTQAGTPGAPTAVRAVASRGSVTVSWKAPTGDGGSPITGYVVITDPGGRSCSTTRLTCKVTGLRAGRYRILVTARNAQGLGEMAPPASVRVTASATQLRRTGVEASQEPRALAGGKSDWYLPSLDESLRLGAYLKGEYWTSSQYAATTAWRTFIGVSYNPVPKTYQMAVRPIRAF